MVTYSGHNQMCIRPRDGHNQICIHSRDEDKITLMTAATNYYYRIMSWWIKFLDSRWKEMWKYIWIIWWSSIRWI